MLVSTFLSPSGKHTNSTPRIPNSSRKIKKLKLLSDMMVRSGQKRSNHGLVDEVADMVISSSALPLERTLYCKEQLIGAEAARS